MNNYSTWLVTSSGLQTQRVLATRYHIDECNGVLTFYGAAAPIAVFRDWISIRIMPDDELKTQGGESDE